MGKHIDTTRRVDLRTSPFRLSIKGGTDVTKDYRMAKHDLSMTNDNNGVSIVSEWDYYDLAIRFANLGVRAARRDEANLAWLVH